ncbi:hypothetical protein ANCDUO_15344 [Ancylostoma duodenale]|uniref:Uncharacterized protein n=1 Tax=Ancylostoma duodenale TaxID=51022 RepID=A0A0C2CDV4_9BILA|nr:hypothetical protein ANCDUO_15344 [Ancylostoma duodenale]
MARRISVLQGTVPTHGMIRDTTGSGSLHGAFGPGTEDGYRHLVDDSDGHRGHAGSGGATPRVRRRRPSDQQDGDGSRPEAFLKPRTLRASHARTSHRL